MNIKKSIHKATFPYVMLTILVITGSLLPGASEGVKYYVGSIKTEKFLDPSVWKDAVSPSQTIESRILQIRKVPIYLDRSGFLCVEHLHGRADCNEQLQSFQKQHSKVF